MSKWKMTNKHFQRLLCFCCCCCCCCCCYNISYWISHKVFCLNMYDRVNMQHYLIFENTFLGYSYVSNRCPAWLFFFWKLSSLVIVISTNLPPFDFHRNIWHYFFEKTNFSQFKICWSFVLVKMKDNISKNCWLCPCPQLPQPPTHWICYC